MRSLAKSGLFALICCLAPGLAIAGYPVEIVPQLGHSNSVTAGCFSEDGRFLLTGSEDTTLKLWHAGARKEMRTFIGHGRAVEFVAISMNGKIGASYAKDPRKSDTGDLIVWDLASGKKLKQKTLTDRNSYYISDLRFMPDGKSLLALSGSLVLRYSTETLGVMESWAFDWLGGTRFALLQDGHSVLIGTSDGKLMRYDLSKRAIVYKVKAHKGSSSTIMAIAVSADEKYVAVSDWQKRVAVLLASDGKFQNEMKAHTHVVRTLLFGSEGLVSGAEDGTVKLWDVETGAQKASVPGRYQSLKWVGVTPDGKECLNFNDKVGLEVRTGNRIGIWGGGAERVLSRVSLDGKYVFFRDGARFWRPGVLEISTGKVDPSLPFDRSPKVPKGSGYCRCHRLNDSLELRVQCQANDVDLWDHSRDKILLSRPSPEGRETEVDFESSRVSSDQQYLALVFERVYRAGVVEIVNLQTGKLVHRIRIRDSEGIDDTRFTPDNRQLLVATGSNKEALSLWNISNGKRVVNFSGTEADILATDFSADGRSLLGGGRDNLVRIFDVRSGKVRKKFSGHRGAVERVAFLNEPGFFMSSANDGVCRIWNEENGRWVSFLSGHEGLSWISYDSEGYWDGSTGGETMVFMVQGLEGWNVDQFAARNNRPDLILQKLPNPDPGLIEHFFTLWQKRLRRLGLKEADLSKDLEVPESKIVSGKQEGKWLSLGIELASKNRELRKYQVYVNDVPIYGTEGKAVSGKTASVNEKVVLTKGENKVEVACIDDGGAESFRAVKYAIWEGTDRPNLYYLAFGTSVYADPAIRSLSFASKDAVDLESRFKAMEGKGFTKVFSKVLKDREVTKAAVVGAKSFLKDAHPDDTLVLFIAGHGIQVASAASPGSAQEFAYYYVTIDPCF